MCLVFQSRFSFCPLVIREKPEPPQTLPNYLRNDDQKAMVSALKNLADGHLYSVKSSSDYHIDQVMSSGGASSSMQLLGKVVPMLTTVPLGKADGGVDFGCSAFCVKSPEGDVLVGRNFDYRFVSSSNVLVHNVTKGVRRVSSASQPFHFWTKTLMWRVRCRTGRRISHPSDRIHLLLSGRDEWCGTAAVGPVVSRYRRGGQHDREE